MSSARFGSLLVALDDLGRSELGSLGVLAGVAARAPLPQEIPALVERYAQLLQPQPVGVGCLTRRFSLPELMFLVDHPVDRTVNLWVFHERLLASGLYVHVCREDSACEAAA